MALQEMSVSNPHSGGDGREEKVVKMEEKLDLKRALSINSRTVTALGIKQMF